MVVKDGVLVNQTAYDRQPNMRGEKFVGRKNMLNSHEDAIDRFLRLIIQYNSIQAQETSVNFTVKDFNDGFKNNNRTYDVQISAVEKPIIPIMVEVSANDVDDITGLLKITRIAYVPGTPPAFIPPPSQPIKK